MNKCKNFEKLIKKSITVTLAESENQMLQKHIASCSECAKLMNINNVLNQSDHVIEKASEEEYNQLRVSVLNKIRIQTEKSIVSKINKIINQIIFNLKKPEYAVAAITLIVGFFLGRALPPDENGIDGGLLKQISNIAEKNTYFNDTKNSSYRFSNVSLKELENNKIAMSFDVSTNLDVVRQKNDPLVKEVLAHSMLDPENIGSNLKAISYSESILDDKLKQALIYTMHNAPVAAVRLKSMEGLMNYKLDPELKEAFVKVLMEEKSMKLNLLAVDYLTKNNYDKDSLRSIIDEVDPNKSTAIFVRAKKNIKTRP